MHSLRRLIEVLQQHLDDNEDLQVAVATQPSWPLSALIYGVWPDDKGTLWLVTHERDVNDTPYAPHCAWDEMESLL